MGLPGRAHRGDRDRRLKKAALVLLLALPAALAAEDEPRPLALAVHVHSVAGSPGRTSLQALASVAPKRGLDGVVVTDNYMDRWSYGLPPFEGLLRFSLTRGGLLAFGFEAYDAILARARKERPGTVVAAGVEASPATRWTGHPATGDLVLEDADRHLLIFGLSPGALRRLPAAANPAFGEVDRRRLVLPSALLLAGLLAAFRRPAGLLLAVFGALWLLDQRPFRRPPAAWTGYNRNGYDAAQALIDFTEAEGGFAVWAHPASDRWAATRRLHRGARARTAPYPEALLETDGYAGFGCPEEPDAPLIAPGGEWDRALAEYAAGKRRRAPWTFAEADPADDRPFDVTALEKRRNIVWAEARTPEAALDALRRGRFYALFAGEGRALALERWRAGDAVSGEAAAWRPGLTLEARLKAEGELVRVTVLRNGAAWAEVSARSAADLRRPLPEPAGTDVYRLLAETAGGSRAVSNPLFVKRR